MIVVVSFYTHKKPTSIFQKISK